MYKYILVLHVLCAAIWTGGHLVLAFTVLPRALKNRSAQILLEFESGFEKIGMPALVVQVITGIWMASHMLPGLGAVLAMDDPASKLVVTKLVLLLATLVLGLDARFRVIPVLSEKTLKSMAYHIIAVTILSVLFVVAGVGFRVGGFF